MGRGMGRAPAARLPFNHFWERQMSDQYCLEAKGFVHSMRQTHRCDWCGRVDLSNHKVLCPSCDRVRRELQRNERSAANQQSKLELRISIKQKEDCISWGESLKRTLDAPVDSSALAGWFACAAKQIARDEGTHRGSENIWECAFTADQRQVLAYMFWEIFSVHARHHRKSRALVALGRQSGGASNDD